MDNLSAIESRYYESPEWTDLDVKHDFFCEILEAADDGLGCACLDRAEEDAKTDAEDRAFKRSRE